MNTAALTERQRHVLDFIKSFATLNGFPPTRKDIASHFGWKSANAAEDHLQALSRKGYVFISKHRARGISIA